MCPCLAARALLATLRDLIARANTTIELFSFIEVSPKLFFKEFPPATFLRFSIFLHRNTPLQKQQLLSVAMRQYAHPNNMLKFTLCVCVCVCVCVCLCLCVCLWVCVQTRMGVTFRSSGRIDTLSQTWRKKTPIFGIISVWIRCSLPQISLSSPFFFFRCLPSYNFDAYLCVPWVNSINYLCLYISR